MTVRDFFRKHVTGITELKSIPVSKVDITKGMSDVPSYKSTTNRLSPSLCRKVALREPMVLKGIKKKNSDMFRAWITVKTVDGRDIPLVDSEIIRSFMFSVKLKNVLQEAAFCSMIYGDGFIEKIYENDAGRSSESAPPKNGGLIDLKILDSEKITERKKQNKINYYVYKKNVGKDLLFHPDRIVHIPHAALPYSDFGVSIIETLKTILESKMNTDEASGELMTWLSHGIQTMQITDMQQEEFDKMMKVFKSQPDALVFNERFNFDIKNPATIAKPEEYFNYFYTNIAAALVMPTHILTGIQPGHVTGTEVGISDYYNDIANTQELVFTLTLEDIFTELLSRKGKTWRYVIRWNPIFVDELSEGKIMEKRINAATIGYQGKLLGLSEARDVVANGVINIDPDLTPDDMKEDAPLLPTGDANVQPKKPEDKKGEDKKNIREYPGEEIVPLKIQTTIHPKSLNPFSRMLIEQAKHDRTVGEQEIVEQEKRCDEAKKKTKLSKKTKTGKKRKR